MGSTKTGETLFVVQREDSKMADFIGILKEYGYGLIFDECRAGITVPGDVKVALIEIDPNLDPSEYQQLITEFHNKCSDLLAIGVAFSSTEGLVPQLRNSGFHAFFRLPLEGNLLVNKVFEIAPIDIADESITLNSLIRINVTEIAPEEKLDFNIYVVLPSNKKILLYRRKNQKVEEKVVERFSNFKGQSFFIKKSDLMAYQQYVGKSLTQLMTKDGYAEIDKIKGVQKELNTLMNGFFTGDSEEEDLCQILSNADKILTNISDADNIDPKLTQQVENLANEHLTHQSHSRNVAVYCALFGLTLGYNSPTALRMGGMLHDVGLADLPEELIAKNPEDMDEDEWAQYQLHPGSGKFTIEQKKLDLPEGVLEMVTQHHEQIDGQGYPYKLKKSETHHFAKICAFADEFDKLTSIRMGHVKLSPKEAMMRIAGLDGKPASLRYDEEFHYPLVKNFLEQIDNPDLPKAQNFFTELNKDKENIPSEEQIEAFFKAAIHGDADEIQKVLGKGYNLNVVDEFGRTPLAYSIIHGHKNIALKLLEHDAEFLNSDKDKNSEIFHAIRYGQMEVVDCIKSKVSDFGEVLKLTNKKQDSPLALAVKYDKKEMAEKLLQMGASAECVSEGKVYTLADLCEKLDKKELLAVLDKHLPKKDDAKETSDFPVELDETQDDKTNNLDINFRNRKGQNYAHIAADVGKLELLQKFHQMQGDLDLKDFNGRSPLFFATIKGHSQLVDFLIEEAKVRLGEKDEKGYSAFMYAIQGGHTEIALKLLSSGDRWDTKIKGVTTLMMAAYQGMEPVVDKLLELGCDPAAKDYRAKSAFHYALANKHTKLANRLKMAG